MKIQDKDYFHGAALTQIVEDPSFTALNKASEKYGHYQVNHDKRLLVKHSGYDDGPWQFTFQPDDIDVVLADVESDQLSFLCLVCGLHTVCLVNEEQCQTLLDLESGATQWIRVEVPPGGRMHCRGSHGNLSRTIAHSHFPSKLFDD